jgi:hypothetical protein
MLEAVSPAKIEHFFDQIVESGSYAESAARPEYA